MYKRVRTLSYARPLRFGNRLLCGLGGNSDTVLPDIAFSINISLRECTTSSYVLVLADKCMEQMVQVRKFLERQIANFVAQCEKRNTLVDAVYKEQEKQITNLVSGNEVKVRTAQLCRAPGEQYVARITAPHKFISCTCL